MIYLTRIVFFFALAAIALAITGIGMNPIRPLHLNKGLSTKYMFFIQPEAQILAKGNLQITFPSEFDKTAIASKLSCMASSLSYSWKPVPCQYVNGSVRVNLGTIKKQQTSVLVSQPTNPTIYQMSSFFSVCLMVDTMVTDCDMTFGKVVFPSAPILNTPTPTALYPSVSSLNTVIVGQSSTYLFTFSLSQSYGTGNTIRITFPQGFQTTSSPICQVTGTYNQVITTYVWPDQRTVECQKINKTLYLNESVKVIGVLNPTYAGSFGNTATGFIIQLLNGTTTIVQEQSFVINTVGITAGSLTGSISQANNFISGDVQYTFYLNLLNSLNSNNFILIRFPNSWILYSGMCKVISGITMAPKTNLQCTNYTSGSNVFLNVSNFISASVSNQLVFSIMVRSPNTLGVHNVLIQTANAKGIVDTMTTTVSLNSTYGDYQMLSINAIVAQSNVPVSGTGPLQLTFFLNYDLPQTNVLTYGKFQLKIFPQIPLPPPLINGVLKCYFFNTIPAQTCTWDTTTSALYTLVTINTPLTLDFQYSQIPLTITTEGAVNSSKIGITIADIVTRYRFELQMFMHNSSSVPTQVYFSEYIAAPILMPLTYYSLTKETNEYTHLRFQFNSPYNITSPLADDLRIKIQFLSTGGGWASNLGFNPNTIYKNYPCVFSDNRAQTVPPQYNSKVTCDLYTYVNGPHASLTNSSSRGPYILVGGFSKWMLINTQLRLQLGGFLIGSSTNVQANVRFSLIQQTPQMLTKYVQLYYNEFTMFTVTTQAIPTPASGGITDSISTSYINFVSNHTIAYTAPSTFFAAIYQFDTISTPSFPSQFVSCTRVNATVANWCTYLGYPVNWVIQYSYSSFSTSVNSIINITNGVYSGTFTGVARIFSSSSITLLKKNFNIIYTPYTIATASFNTDGATSIYKGSELYYYISFTAVISTPDNGFIRLIYGSYANLGPNPFCTSSNVLPLVNELGLICTIESSTTMKISNIQGLNAGSSYTLRVRIYGNLSSLSNFRPTVTVQTHYSISADPSIVNQINSLLHSSNPVNYYTSMNQFKINNPRITYQTTTVGYIGKFEVQFSPSGDILSSNTIKMIFNNHAWNGGIWTTPTSQLSDPLVCMINYIRVACSFTLSPLTVTMNVNPASINNGQSNMITLDTEYLPYNGIMHPSQGGTYNLYLQFYNSNSILIQQQSFYHQVLPPKLRNFYVNSSVNDVGVQNMFYFQFELGSTMVNPFNDGTMYSRIFIEFPTVDSLGNQLFANDLGGYQKTGELVGCVFDTWSTYYARPVTSYRLQCRLIMSQSPGDPVRVQVLHQGAFSSSWRYMRFWMAKVFNPNIAVTSVPISIRINHVQVSTNHVYELYYDTFDVFLNSQTASTTNYNYGCQDFNSEIMISSTVNSVGRFRFTPKIIGSWNSIYGYYFALDTTNSFKPKQLQNYYGSNYCHGSYYDLCLTFPDINYIVIHVISSSSHHVNIYVDFPNAISQYQTSMVAKVWNQYRYMGTQTLQITPTCWSQLTTGFSNTVQIYTTPNTGQDYYKGKRKAELRVNFNVDQPVPAGGSIQINFPPSVTVVYPHCRSMNNLGSTASVGGAIYTGEVGCLVQTTNTSSKSWVITGFNTINAGSYVAIVGQIDLPTSSGYLGYGQIITYNNTDPTNMRTNGFIIGFWNDNNFGINVNNDMSHNVDSQITLQETLPLRTNYVGPLRIKFMVPGGINGPYSGKITVRIPAVSTIGVNGGFSYLSNKKHVCQILQVTNFEQTGCIISSVDTDNSTVFPNYLFTIYTSGTLSSSILYKLIITTHTGSQPEGLTFPTTAGTYKIDFNFDSTGSTGFSVHNHLYLQVYGTKWNYILCQQFNSIPGQRNLLWFKITPTTTIQTTQQIIIEIPTKSSAGAYLFDNDLGTGLSDGGVIPVDILASPFATGFMSCNLFKGDQSNYLPARIVCGNLQSTISSSQVLWFAITVINPSLAAGFSKISIPFFLYSYQQGTTYKTNFDVIQNAVYLRNDYASRNQPADVRSQNVQLQTSGMYLDLITRNNYNVNQGEYYVIFFSFPLRNNGLISNGCTYPGGSTYGDAIYHLNNWVIVCSVTTGTAIGVPGDGYTTRNLRISGFFTPFFYLSGSEQFMVTYAYHFNSRYTTWGGISDGYSNEGPKTSSSTSLSISTLHEGGTWYAGVRDDYTFTFTYSSSATNDLAFVKKIALIFPSSIDYVLLESDCIEAPTSQVEIASCYIDTSDRVIWIYPVVKASYTSNMAVSVMTRGLAVRNPINNLNTNNNQFIVKYYTWQNISEPGLSPRSNNYYCYLMINNFPSSGIGYNYNPSPYSVQNFNYISFPHQRYYLDTPFSSLTHRAPFEMSFYPSVTFTTSSGTNYHMIKVIYPSTFGDATMFKIRDIQVFRPVCYLNNQRIRQCVIDTTNKAITLSFTFALSTSTKYHLKVSILDSRNADVNGFLATIAVSNLVLIYKPYGASVWQYTQTDQFPTLYSLPTGATTGPFRGITAGTVTYGHTVPSQLNYVSMLLTFNRTDITGLVFQIPSVDKNGNALFNSAADLSTTFLGQQNGGSYPCGNNGYNAGGAVTCYILNGNYAQVGVVTRIIMSDFTYVTQMNCRFVFVNPPNNNAFFSVLVKAFGGTPTANNPYGNQLMGQWEFNQIFQINNGGSASSSSYTANSITCPSSTPWRNNTNFYVYSQNSNIGSGRSAVAAITYYDQSSAMTDKLFCEPTLGSNNAWDDLLTFQITSGGVTKRIAYFVTTFQGLTNVSTSTTYGWTLSYLKCKYFANYNIVAFFYYSDTYIQVATNSFNKNYCNGYTGTAPALVKTSQSHYNNNGTAITYLQEFDITAAYNSVTNFNFRSGDQMVLSITYTSNYWGNINNCAILGGVSPSATNLLPTCTVGSNTNIYISNIGGFVTNPSLVSSTNMRIRIKFVATPTSSYDQGNYDYSFYMSWYANLDAYIQGFQGILYQTNSLVSGTGQSSCYWQNTGSCTLMQTFTETGTFTLNRVTDTSMQVMFAPSSSLNFGSTVFQHDFIISFDGFTFGYPCTVSNVDIQMSYSTTPGTGVNNTFPADSVACNWHWFQLIFNSRTLASYWGGQGPASDNIWATNEYMIIYITFSPYTSNSDLPKLENDYIFIQGSYNYRTSGSWNTNIARSLQYTPQALASSASITTLSNNRGAITQFSFTLTSLQTKLGPLNNNYYLLAEFISTSGWTGSNQPFATYTNTNVQTDFVACKCIAGSSPLTTSASSPYVDTICKRRLPTASFGNYAILIGVSAAKNQDLMCFFPEFMITTSTVFRVQFKLIHGDTYPDERLSAATTKYSSKFRIQSNLLNFTTSTPNMNSSYVTSFSSSQSTNFYASTKNVGSSFTNTYTLSGSWGSGLTSPFIYINFMAAGPIPIDAFCSDPTIYLQCRVYKSIVNIVVAQLKLSVSSYSISNGGNPLSYPSSQFSASSAYGASIYVTSGGQWQYTSGLSRSKSSLTPISTNTFLVYSDVYGSSRSSYATNIFFSVNPSGQTLYNYALTGSMMVISWSGLTVTQNCQVWVQNEPLVTLTCKVSTASSTLTVYSTYFDYTTYNNIIISMGLTNPTAGSTNFNLVLYSSYYSASWNSITISRSATYSVDTTYTAGNYTQISKSSVEVFPFQARISTVANAPLRVRFNLASSSLQYSNGQIRITYSQIGYSTAHLCYFIAYTSFASMMQQTERKIYKAKCTSSSTTIYVTPPPTLTLNSGSYYELVMMPLNINTCGGGCPTQSGYLQTNFDNINMIAYNNINTSPPGIIGQQIQKLYAYEGASYIGLQHIYVLCVQPRITSVYLSININFTSSNYFPSHYLEITLFDMSISAFSGFSVGSIVPCQLSSNFVAVSGRQSQQCRVVSADLLNGFIRVRIQNIGPLYPQTYWVTFDDIILPTPTQSDNNNKFDISITYFGPSNVKYENYFPEIFQVDNTNSTAPITSSSYTFNNPAATGFGNPITGQVQFNWPFDSSSSSYESKLALNFNGGYSNVWQSLSSVTFLDNTGTYTLLWVNKALNKFVFLLPNKGNGVSTTLNITSLNNPYPYQRELYNTNSTNVIINFYNNFFLANSRTFNQPSFSIFTMNPSIIFINQNTPCNNIDNYPSTNTIAPGSTNIIILNIQFGETSANIIARNLGNINIKFTSGISFIRECRAMLNTTQYVNTKQTCQPYYDGTYWYVKLYDIVSSQLNSGWWVQVMANFTSATLSYTSQVMASNNLVVEYQSPYTVGLSVYNSSRSIPTVLSWLDNRYVLFFHEVQHRFLDAVSNQKTPYLRFRFTLPYGSSNNNDVFYIYLPDNTANRPYTPVNNMNNLVVQFLPALSSDRDFSVGVFADAQLLTSGCCTYYYYYSIQMRSGGLVAGRDYLMQISQYNTATSSFYMSTSPNRQLIKWMYQFNPSVYNWQYWDNFYIKSYTRFRSVQLLHTTTTVNDYDTLTINFTPYGSLSAASSNNEIALRLSVQTRYHSADGGVTAIYTADAKSLVSGGSYSGWVSNANNNEVNVIQFGQYSIANTPLRFSLSKQNAYVDNTAYTYIIPLMQNPSTAYVTLRYNLTLVHCPSSGYEYIFNMYQSINEYYTVSDTSASTSTSIANGLRAVQTVSNVDLSVNMGLSLNQWNTAIFKINNALPGLIPNIVTPNDTSNYNYYYFKNILMIMAQKKSANNVNTIGIGASSSTVNYQSTFGLSWVRIFNNSNAPLATNPYTLYYSTPPTLTITTLNSYAASSLSLLEGYRSVGSTALYLATFTTAIIPQGGQIRILFDNSVFSSNMIDACRVGSGFVRSSSDNQALRCYKQSQGYRIAGFSGITASTSIQVYFKLTSLAAASNSAIQADIFGIYLDNTTRISLANIGTINITASNVPNYLLKFQSMVIPYWGSFHSNNYYLIEGTFNLRSTTINNGDYLFISEPGWTVYGTRRLLIKQNSSAVTGWTQLSGYYWSSNYYRFQIPNNFLVSQQANPNTQYLFRYTSYYPSGYYNGFVAGGAGVSKFWLTANDAGSNAEISYFDFVTFPEPFAMTITNRYKAAGRLTMLDLRFDVDVDVPATTSQLVFTFDTNNLLNDMFANDLEGAGTNGATYRYLDCAQYYTYNISNGRIVCILYFGNNLANPPIPANLTITFTKLLSAFTPVTTIRVLIANVLNPSTVSLNTGVKANINFFCQNQQNLPCSTYEARGFYVTTNGSQNIISSDSSTFSSSSPLVLATGLTHTFSIPITSALTTSDAIYIVYPQNFQGLMPLNCSVSGYSCYVFPTRRWVVLLPSGTKAIGTLNLAITSMNNPYYAQPYSQYFKVTLARASALGEVYFIPQNAFTPVSYSFVNLSNPTSVSVTPTQTPSMYLRNYANTVIFYIYNLFSDSRMKAIYIKAPADVTSWDPTYCNASITATSNFNYPLRFTCIVDPNTPNFLRLTLDSDMSTYDTNWGQMTIKVHAKFTLADFPTAPTLYQTSPVTSGSFYFYSSMNSTSSSNLYYMSQISLTISIIQHQVPIISVINFNTQSFANRLARVNNKQVFYLLFKPLVATTIGSIVFTIPSQFNYPGVFTFDNCLMIGRTTISQPNCQLSRYQGQTLVTLTPTGYDNQVKIFQIGTVDQANWFTAPNLPGDFYRMNTAVYSPNGTLISKLTKNISPVYGQNLDIPSISIANVQDRATNFAAYDIQFVTGTLQIPPGAPTTATTQTSKLQFIFQNFNGMNTTNVFSNDLRTGLATGSEVGCVIRAGMTALPGLRMKCILTVGTSQTNKPTISIINYNFINPGTTINITFAGIQTLPTTLVNTISIGAMIYYNDIGSSTYLYIPTPVITVPTQSTSLISSINPLWTSNWNVNASYSGTNIVLQPTTFSCWFSVPYYWTGNIGGLFSGVNYTYWGQYVYTSAGALDEFILLTFYPATLLDKNNPVAVSCSGCISTDIYYAAGMVRFRHSSSTTGYFNNRTFTFTNFPTSAYAIANQTAFVNMQFFYNYQCFLSKNISLYLPRTVQKCTKFNFGVVSVSSLNGGEVAVAYLFSIVTNHFVPANGALSITLPLDYGDMIANQATCKLIGFQNTNCYCKIATPSRIDIYANGTQLSTSTTYSVQVTGLQNPNIQSSNYIFIVTSYYVDNIYLSRKICENQITPPSVNIKPLRTCTLSWTPQYDNQNFNASYVFQLSCSDVFRSDSILYINLPQAYSTTNKIGTLPCSSYESTTLVTPVCTISNINGIFTLSTKIDASSQSSLSLIVNLVNPINNTYSASAYVTSKGTQYASSTNSSIVILSNSYVIGQSGNVQLLNTPKQAGLSSTYVFKIAPITSFTPTLLGVTFPSNFYVNRTQLKVAIANTAISNFFSFLSYNNIQALISNASAINGIWINSYPTFTTTDSSLYLTNISSQVSLTQWTYLFVSGIQNPSSYQYANFTLAYYLISNGFQALQWVYQYPLTYYISPPPQYISIKKVIVSDFDILYPANYTFNFSTTSGNVAIAGKNLSYIIVIPTFYKSTLWANAAPVCSFAQLSRTSSCYSYQGEIIVTQIFAANYSSLSLTISTILNPSLPTNCNTTDTTILAQTFFIIRIIDTLSNSFLFESSSVVDSSNCLTFSAIRIPISLQYSLIMSAGLAYNITYGLTKPASNLKIAASVSNSGFTFSPAIVDFNDYYTLSKSTQLFLRSDVPPGTYVLNFVKSESSANTYFRNILPVIITVVAAAATPNAASPTISIPTMSDSTVGYPVSIPVVFSLPSSTQMTLFLTLSQQSNQTLTQYSPYLANFSITPRIINIMPQQTSYNFTVIQGLRVVPPPLTLNFKLTSNYPIVHSLTTPTMYLCFDRDPKFNVLYPPLRVTLTPFLSSCNLQDVGKAVTNIMVSNLTSQSSAKSVTPKIIDMSLATVASTGASIKVNSISAGFIYYLCIETGYPSFNNSDDIVKLSNKIGVKGVVNSSALTVSSGKTGQVNFVANVVLTGLKQISTYIFYAVSNNNLGSSAISSIQFSTTMLSNGAQMTLPFTSIVSTLSLVNALVQVLRITPNRIKVLTSEYKLTKQQSSISVNDNQVTYNYDIVISPDPSNDIISPIVIIKNFVASSSTLATFQSYLPTFVNTKSIKYFEIMPILPIVVIPPYTKTIGLYTASFGMKLKRESKIYAVLYQYVGQANGNINSSQTKLNPILISTLTAQNKAIAPTSNQIYAGKDYQNNVLSPNKIVKTQTDSNGDVTIYWPDLKPKSLYIVFVTAAASPLLYEPPLLWTDDAVITFNFTTMANPNIGGKATQEASLKQFSKINPKLGDALLRATVSNQKKTSTNGITSKGSS